MFKFWKKKGISIAADITAIDKKVIARKGERIDARRQTEICELGDEAQIESVRLQKTNLMQHFQAVMQDPKYTFLQNSAHESEDLFSVLGEVRLNRIVLDELEWMQKLDYFYHHTIVITMLVTRLAIEMTQKRGEAIAAASCALTHDFGMNRIPRDLLQKAGKLHPDEFQLIQEHPFYSYLILCYYLGDAESLLARVAYEHHENLQGSGYPRGVPQESMISQLIRLADSYDALITARPFRPPMSPERALNLIRAEVENGVMNAEAYHHLRKSVEREGLLLHTHV